MPLDPAIEVNVLSATITTDKTQIFREHPRSVSFRFDNRWYQGIRVSAFNQDVEMTRFAYNPDTDTVLKINFARFTGVDGAGVVPPGVTDRIRMDNIDWRVEDTITEADDLKLILRKEVPPA